MEIFKEVGGFLIRQLAFVKRVADPGWREASETWEPILQAICERPDFFQTLQEAMATDNDPESLSTMIIQLRQSSVPMREVHEIVPLILRARELDLEVREILGEQIDEVISRRSTYESIGECAREVEAARKAAKNKPEKE